MQSEMEDIAPAPEGMNVWNAPGENVLTHEFTSVDRHRAS